MTQQALLSNKRAHLARLLQQKRQHYSYSLSYGQQALWFIYQDAPDSPAYNMAWSLELQGHLDSTTLQTALQALVDRHASLRTTFDLVDGEPIQTVHPTGTGYWHEHQAIQWSTQQLKTALKTAYEQPFHLTHGPVLRVHLFQIELQRYILLLTMHHILGDASSLNILGHELLTIYQAKLAGHHAILPELVSSYADFVRIETEMLDSSTSKELIQYWRNRLGSENPILNLPTDYPRPAIQSYHGTSIPFHLSTTLSQQLKHLAQQEKSTLFSLLLTAFQVLLYRYTGQTEIWIGTPTSTNRRQPQFAHLIGYLVNPVVLRTTFDSATSRSFSEYVAQTQQTVLEALEHSTYPFPLLVKTLHPQRDFSYTPLFQALIDFKPADFFPLPQNIPGITNMVPFELAQMEAQFDLTLSITEGERLTGWFKYNVDLFKPDTIERMINHFHTLLTAVVSNPKQLIHQLPILTAQDIQQLQAWNDTTRDYPKHLTLTDLFEQQVNKTPDHLALIYDERQLNYSQLNAQANQLAHYLLNLRTQTGTALLLNNPLIAISMERSLDMVTGLLGILKAGGAYVPIDPGYPPDRIRYMLHDSATPVLLTQSHLKNRLSLDQLEHECVVLCLDEVDLAGQSSEDPLLLRKAEDLAYVIYTSGSTGQPKGAMNAHVGIVNRLMWMQEAYQLTHQDRVLQKTPFSFDVSVWEFFWPLLTGASLVMAQPEGHKDPAYLAKTIIQHDITVLHFVPSMLKSFITHTEVKNCHSLRQIMCSGEALTLESVQQFFALFPEPVKLHNLYGPTEAAVDVTHWSCQRETDFSLVPIGKPIANTQIYILDAHHHIMPIGIPGELCIAGIQVGRGYFQRPELTAEKFIEVDIFGKTQRIYRTGDLARWSTAGELEYLGRIDHQVKLRGFRIELGEIESTLLQVPGIKECIVTLRDTGQDHKQLIAYLVTDTAKNQETDLTLEAKEYLKQKLPEYMVPALFIFVEAFPLTPNGKVDLKALPEPLFRKESFAHPRDAIELRLIKLWEKLFSLPWIGVRDDFFEIGGDSLLAIRLIFGIKQEFGITIPLHALFQNRTVERLACIVRHDAAPTIWSPIVCLQPQGSKTPLFFVHASGGSAFDYLEVARFMGTDRPFYAIHPRGIEAGESFHASIEEMAIDYVAAIRHTQPHGPYLFAGWSFGGSVAFEMTRILEQAGETVSLIIMIDTPAPFGAQLYKEDDIEFLMDRVPHYHGVTLNELDVQNSREAQLTYILKEIKLAGLFRPDIDLDYARNWFRLYKHHNKIISLYRPSGPIQGQIILFTPAEETPFDAQMGQPVLGWRPLAPNGFEVYESPGNHFNMVSPVNTPILVEKMKECIERLT